MDTLREVFRYHTWATLRLIDHCQELPPEALHESAPGTMGTVLATLVHLVAAEGRYLAPLPVERVSRPLREGMEPPLAEVRSVFAEQARRWEALLDRGPELNVTLPARRGWPDTPHAETLLFLQCLHHGNDHRTHIGTILGAHGREVPDLDGWAYWATVHHHLA